MKRLNYLIGLSILVALILVMVAIVPASADAPMHPGHFKYIWTDDFPADVCGVTMAVHSESKLEYIYYCDKNGTCRGDNYHDNAVYTFTYGDRSLTLRHSGLFGCTWLTTEEPIDQICRSSGAEYKGSLPGYGVVIGWVGRTDWYETGCRTVNGEFVCETFELLHSSGMEFYDEDAICTYMLNEE